MAEKIIYAISDSLGETAEAVARATASQYDKEQIEIVRIPYIAVSYTHLDVYKRQLSSFTASSFDLSLSSFLSAFSSLAASFLGCAFTGL